MKDEYAPRATIPLPEATTVTHPEELPELVHLKDPAKVVFTDFTREQPATVSPETSIVEALERMQHAGICALLVIDDDQRLLGEITADEIMGDKPVRLMEMDRIERDKISVSMIMTPASRVRVLEIEHLRDARVGHIVATLHALESRHVLVVENGAVRGLYSANQISRQLGQNIMDEECPAHSLYEIVHSLG